MQLTNTGEKRKGKSKQHEVTVPSGDSDTQDEHANQNVIVEQDQVSDTALMERIARLQYDPGTS